MNRKAIENAVASSKPAVRRLTQGEVEERHLDIKYEWLVVNRKIRQGIQLIPDGDKSAV